MPQDTPASAPPRLLLWLGTPARRRMAVLVAAALPFGLFTHASDVIIPLWATHELGYSAAEWAHLRSVRYAGVLVGTILVSVFADRLGQRAVGMLSLWLAAASVLAMSGGSPSLVWIGMALMGVGVSNALVSLATLTQAVSVARQGMANALYRAALSTASIFAPLGATALAAAWGGYPTVLRLGAALLALAGVVLCFYPAADARPPFRGWKNELRGLWRTYVEPMRNRELTAFLHLSLLYLTLALAVPGFVAIRVTRELGRPDQQFGAAMTIAGALTVLGMIGLGLRLDRMSVRRTCAWLGALSGAFVLLMGVTASADVTLFAVVPFTVLFTLTIAPANVWLTRTTTHVGSAFALQKVLAALYIAVTMVILGWLEALLGIRTLLAVLGVACIAASLAHLLLREPVRRAEPLG